MRGSLYLAVMFVATIFAAATGIVGASVTILGIMAGKSMIRSGYDVKLSSGLIAAGGTLGILIPPSIMLVVMGPVLEVPVTTLFAAAIVPGLHAGAALHRLRDDPLLDQSRARAAAARERAAHEHAPRSGCEFFLGLVPPAALVLAALGSIVFGLATPTEGAACGAHRRAAAAPRPTGGSPGQSQGRAAQDARDLGADPVPGGGIELLRRRVRAPRHADDAHRGAARPRPASRYVMLVIIMALIFLLGWPLEWVPIVLIVVPFLLPLVAKLGFDKTWFGILVAVNLQTAWLSPPVAMSAYFLKGVVPQWQLGDIYKGMMQFMVLQLIGLVLIIVFPQIVLWLPNYIYGK